MSRSSLPLALVGCAALMASPAAAHDHTVLRGRLVFSDHESPEVRVLDLDSGKVTDSVKTTRANATLIPTDGGRYVVIRTGDDAGTIQFLDSGIVLDEHGDHHDVEKEPVRLLPHTLTGDKPSHVVSDHGWVSVFFDGQRPWIAKSNPRVVNVRLNSLGKDRLVSTEWPSPGPQHGIAVPLGRDEFLFTMPKDAYMKSDGQDKAITSRPFGYRIMASGKSWKEVARFDDANDRSRSCLEFHGHAIHAGAHVFGCNEKTDNAFSDGGLLLISRAKKGWTSRKLDYPDSRRASTIKGAGAGDYVVGNYGKSGTYDAFLRINARAKALTLKDVFPVPGGQGVCQYELSHDGKQVINLTADGKLRLYSLAPDWKEEGAWEMVAPFDCGWDAKEAQPSLAISGSSAFVSDPKNGRIREFHLKTRQQGLDYEVGGKPTRIAGGGNAG